MCFLHFFLSYQICNAEVAPPAITVVRNQIPNAAAAAASSSPARSSSSGYSQSSDSDIVDDIDGEENNETAGRNSVVRISANKTSTIPLNNSGLSAKEQQQNAAALSALLQEKDMQSAKVKAIATRQSSSSPSSSAVTAPAPFPASSASSSMVSAGLSKSHLQRPSISGSNHHQRPPNNVAGSHSNSTSSRAAAMAAACEARAAEAEALMDPVRAAKEITIRN